MAIWALPLSIDGASPPPSNCRPSTWYSEFDRNHEISPCWSLPVLYPHAHIWRRQPKSCFGENQLFPDSISFSLLTTSHPRGLHISRVRTSPQLSSGFILLMVSSSGFGSLSFDERAINTRFRYACAPEGLRQIKYSNSLARSAKSTLSAVHLAMDKPPTLCKQMVSGSISPGSSPYFSPFPHGTGSLSVILNI